MGLLPGLASHAVDFRGREGYWFTSYLIEYVGRRRGCFRATLDLGVTWVRVCIIDNTLVSNMGDVSLDKVVPSRVDRVVYYDPSTGESYEVVKSDNTGYYKLKALAMDKAPTIEINGIHMHRIKGVDPWTDSRRKISVLGIRHGERVLDTCMGLGYTTIHSLIRGAGEVYTFEIDDNVLWIAEHNPWSQQLGNPRVHVIHSDIVELIGKIPDEYFDKIIHDPPRYSSTTGDLYGEEFYRELYRVLKPGGRLFHYTGEPRRHGSPSIVKGIGERLRKAGFHPVIYKPGPQGYLASKPVI